MIFILILLILAIIAFSSFLILKLLRKLTHYRIFTNSLTNQLANEFDFLLAYCDKIKKSELLMDSLEVQEFIRIISTITETYNQLIVEFKELNSIAKEQETTNK